MWVVATLPLRCGMRNVPLPVGYPLPGWVQRDPNMLRILKSLNGDGCIEWKNDGPSCPLPRADAVPSPPPAVPMSEAEQKDASWREWIQMKAQPWKHSGAPVEEKSDG